MAFAKEMTIATGHTVRLNGDEHEIKVSLTYELERDDYDVLLLAAVKAGEVQKAHKAACQQMHSMWTTQRGFADDEAPAELDGDEILEDEDEPPASTVAATFEPPPPAPIANGHAVNGGGQSKGSGFARPTASAPQADMPQGPPAEEQPDKPIRPGNEPASTPQKIAIRSLAKQAGLDETRFRDFLWDNFETVRLDTLTKYQAALLMLALKDGSWKNGLPHANVILH